MCNNSNRNRKDGEQRSNPLNKGIEKPSPSEELKKVLKEEAEKNKD